MDPQLPTSRFPSKVDVVGRLLLARPFKAACLDFAEESIALIFLAHDLPTTFAQSDQWNTFRETQIGYTLFDVQNKLIVTVTQCFQAGRP